MQKIQVLGSELPFFQGKIQCGEHLVGLIVDCETTGLSPKSHTLIELGLISIVCGVDCVGGRFPFLGVKSAYEGTRDPGSADISHIAMGINKIDLKMLHGMELDIKAILKIVKPVNFIIAHNANFDRSFILPVLPFLETFPWLCSQKNVPWKRYGFCKTSLPAICEEALIKPPKHRALDDCRALIEILSTIKLNDSETPLDLLLKNFNFESGRLIGVSK